ncbi:hypothetical protein F0562_017705 [Nyssa sinensis]|uniref:Uncharacterized protein n=1 Tax=Nyssa sinensis TaxID=561372 RepID=A0A5J4ZIT0_9ASTE|nr:hypothetical protein F0562_017705 [Nyssa sinensis]
MSRFVARKCVWTMVIAEMMTEIQTVSRIGIVGQVLRLVLWVAATVLSILGLLEYSDSGDTEMELQQGICVYIMYVCCVALEQRKSEAKVEDGTARRLFLQFGENSRPLEVQRNVRRHL